MKKTTILIFLIATFCSCKIMAQSQQPLNEALADGKLAGLWTEHWGATDSEGSETNVNYVDTLQIEVAGNSEITIHCINNSDYIYSKARFEASKLSFKMENTVDPKERFTIQYTLTVVSENELNGQIINSRGKVVPVKLKKQKQ